MKKNMNKVYVSPVCHLVEVAAQIGIICDVSGGDTPAAPIINPGVTPNPNPGPSVAPKRI